MYRGDIVFIRNHDATGHEEQRDRYAVVVSNKMCNCHSPALDVVYLTTHKFGKDLPTHVIITSSPRVSIAMCEAVYSVDVSRIVTVVGSCSDVEMKRIDQALLISLGLIERW